MSDLGAIMTGSEIDERSPRCGLDFGTRTAVLAIQADNQPVVVPARDGNELIPVRMRLTPRGVTVGTEVEADRSDVIPARPGDLYELGGDNPRIRGENAFPLKDFLKEARRFWIDSIEKSPDVTLETVSVVVPVPGGCDERDRNWVRTAVAAAGFDPLGTVRAPIPMAAADRIASREDGTFVVVNLGTSWFDAAILSPAPGNCKFEVHSRVSVPDLGLATFERTLTHWLLDERGAVLPDVDESDLRRHVTRAVETLITTNRTGVPVFPDDSVALSLDATVRNRALEGTVSKLVDVLDRLVDDSGCSIDTVEGVVLAGGGSQLPLVKTTFEAYFETQPRPPTTGSPLSAPALGASTLAAEFGTDVETVDDTIGRDIAVETITETGAEYVTPFTSAMRPDQSQQITLQTTEDDQIRGSIRIATKHRILSRTDEIAAFELVNVPARPAGEVTINLELTPTTGTPSDVECAASVADASIDTDTGPDIDAHRVDPASTTGPRFALSGVDLDAIAVPDRDRYEPIARREPDANAFEAVSPKVAIDRIIDIRNEFWTAVNEEISMSSDELETRLRKMDNGLKHAGIEPIDPDEGEEWDDELHYIYATQESSMPPDRIVEVHRPGYRIDDVVAEPATVIVSSGTPGLNQDEGVVGQHDGDEHDTSSTDTDFP